MKQVAEPAMAPRIKRLNGMFDQVEGLRDLQISPTQLSAQ